MEEKVFITNKKGLKLAAILHYPDKDKKHPGVILLHGFMGYKEEAHLEILARELSSKGFASIRFDASGFGESEGTFINDFRITNYLSDIESVHEYFSNLTLVDDTRIGLTRHSMGAMLTIIYSAINKKIKAIAPISPPSKFTAAIRIAAVLNRWKEEGFLERISSKYGSKRIPYDFVTDSLKYDTITDIKRVTTPILVILGTADNSVDPDDTRTIFLAANEPKEILEIDGMNHDYKVNPEQIKIVNRRVISFFEKYL